MCQLINFSSFPLVCPPDDVPYEVAEEDGGVGGGGGVSTHPRGAAVDGDIDDLHSWVGGVQLKGLQSLLT